MKPLTDKRESPYLTGCREGDPEARGRLEGRDIRRLSFDGGGASGGGAGGVGGADAERSSGCPGQGAERVGQARRRQEGKESWE